MSIDKKMKKIDVLVTQLESEVQKICVDDKCKTVKEIKKPKNKNSKTITNS